MVKFSVYLNRHVFEKISSFEPCHEKKIFIAYTDSECLDHPCSLISGFEVRLQKHQILFSEHMAFTQGRKTSTHIHDNVALLLMQRHKSVVLKTTSHENAFT